MTTTVLQPLRQAAERGHPADLDRLAVVVAGSVATVLAPWTVYLGQHLENRTLLWVGIDVAECITAAAVAVLAARTSRWAPTAARLLTVLLAGDAILDVAISHSWSQRVTSSALALAVELPLAAAAWWWAARTPSAARARVGQPRWASPSRRTARWANSTDA